MRTLNLLIAFSVMLFMLSACDKKNDPDPVPVIELVSIEPREVVEFIDTIRVVISYEDGDGDLGFFDADSNSIFVQDQRLEKPDSFYLPPMAPLDAKVWIKGELEIFLGNTFLIGNAPEEKTRFFIRLRDRAGNMSNELITPEITIKRAD